MRRRKITAEARHLQSANHHSRRAAPENREQAEVLKVHESEREKADSGAQFVECKVSAEGAEQSEEPAIGERKTRRIDQEGAPAVLERGDGKQSRVNRRQRLDIRSGRLSLGLRRNGNINEDARVLWLFLLASPSDGDRESEIFRGRSIGVAALFHFGSQRSGCRGNAIIERERVLRFVRRGPAPLCPIGLDALIQLAAPLLVDGAVRREMASRASRRFF